MPPTTSPAKRKRQPTYSDAQRANALATLKANGGNLNRTRAETGVSRPTLKAWRDADLSSPKLAAIEELRDLAERSMTEVYEHGRRKAALLCIRDLEHIDAYKRGLLSAVFTDKVLLLNGQPTVITARQVGPALTADQLRAFLALHEAAARTVTSPALSAHTETVDQSTT